MCQDVPQLKLRNMFRLFLIPKTSLSAFCFAGATLLLHFWTVITYRPWSKFFFERETDFATKGYSLWSGEVITHVSSLFVMGSLVGGTFIATVLFFEVAKLRLNQPDLKISYGFSLMVIDWILLR